MQISILLPYKENYSKDKAGAVSLFVKDLVKSSIFKNNIKIFGSTNNKKILTKNYINIESKSLFLKSSNSEYVKNFIQNDAFKRTDILEIHNRPNYIKLIKPYYKNKIFLFFHNDPLSMNGSKSKDERVYLLNNVDRIIFNSNWSKNRFFINIEKSKTTENKTTVCYQSTSKTKINFSSKNKTITFIGKLNTAKGYDLFGNTIIKILNKYKDWKAYVIGDEPREIIEFKHDNLKILGFKNNDFILNFLKKNSISIICSRWEEPFGRTSLEAASRGCATIISNRGGLPETSKSAIILKSLNEKNLYKKISELIDNPKKLLKFQKNNYNNFYLTHKFVSNILDNLRKKFIITKFNLNLKKKFKILHITNFNYRFDGRLQYNTGRRINNGFVRLGHNVLTLSDRDILNQNKSLTDPFGKKTLEKKIINSYENFKPDLAIFGHADNVSLEAISYLKDKGVKLSQWFLDPISKHGPDYNNNKKRILDKIDFLETSFITTDPNALDFEIKNSFFMPNPCDESFEIMDNSKKNCDFDVFFAMSHGVHRGDLKKGKNDNREIFLKKLVNMNKLIKFDIYGMNNIQPIWGDDFINNLSNSSMGLNLSRGKPIKYYSSDRIAQLMGNGLLTFIDEKTKFSDFFSNKEIVTYKDINDLSYKLNKYKKDAIQRKKIAGNGKKSYFKYFNSTLVSRYIINKTLDIKNTDTYIWEK